MYVMKKCIPNITLKEIGVQFNKDHATVLHSVKKVEEAIEADQIFKNTVNNTLGSTASGSFFVVINPTGKEG